MAWLKRDSQITPQFRTVAMPLKVLDTEELCFIRAVTHPTFYCSGNSLHLNRDMPGSNLIRLTGQSVPVSADFPKFLNVST